MIESSSLAASHCRRALSSLLVLCGLFLTAPHAARADEAPPFVRTADVIYGRKYGMALTLDIFKPAAKANGAAVVWVVSGGWVSAHEIIDARFAFSPIN